MLKYLEKLSAFMIRIPVAKGFYKTLNQNGSLLLQQYMYIHVVNMYLTIVLTCINAEIRIIDLAIGLEEKSRAPFFWLASYVLNDHPRLTTEDTIEYI